MIRFQTEQTIDRPAQQEIWTYAADITRHPQWMGVIDARLVSGPATEHRRPRGGAHEARSADVRGGSRVEVDPGAAHRLADGRREPVHR